ncbi:MAG: hypothetical protein CME63_03560 [Halobacteriovoraceae bacterium]|nr:hypothetical protein [Halobacteriovoraceae bacterium]
MSNQNFDFDFLARETLALTEKMRSQALDKANSEDDCAFFMKDQSEQFELDFFEDAFDFSKSENYPENYFEKYEDEDSDQYQESYHSNINNDLQTEEENENLDSDQDESGFSPEGPGVLYKLEKGISTFCLRGLATSDAQWEIDAIERRDPKILKTLRLNEEEGMDLLGFFPTYDQAFGETIIDQLINRRFPKQEAIVCNLSDPGFSWWLSCGNQSFEVYFQSHGIERDENLIQLGPLGDPLIAYQYFKKSFPFLKSQFSINEFSATEKGFQVTCGKSSESEFQQLVQLFIDGRFPWEDSVFNSEASGHSVQDKGLLLYFYEISLLRKFWIDVQNQLNE